jgi:hypothetical protein
MTPPPAAKFRQLGYAASNVARLPRGSWLKMPAGVRRLFRHRVDGEVDVLQPRKQSRPAGGPPPLAQEECVAAEAALMLEKSPFLQAQLERVGILGEVRVLCSTVQVAGFCKIGASDGSAVGPTLLELAALRAGGDTVGLLAAAPRWISAQLGRPALLGAARGLLDMHVRVGAVSVVAAGSDAPRCGFPCARCLNHRVCHRRPFLADTRLWWQARARRAGRLGGGSVPCRANGPL